jgi:hypothetical protein
MLTVLTQNSGFRRSAGCISREWRQKGEFSPEPSGSQSRVRLAAQVECGLPANADHR